MQQLYELFFTSGLRPFALTSDTLRIEQNLTRSDMSTLLILHLKGDLPMSELASLMGAPLSTMTSIAKRLEIKGYIARAASPHDQRVKLVALTQEGRRLAEESEQIMKAALGRLEAAFTPEEMETFLRLLFKAAKVFQEGGPIREREMKSVTRKITIEE